MPDMYEKLGDLLNDALNSGKIPQDENNQDRDTSNENCDKSGPFSFNKVKIPKSDEHIKGEVIKMHKYTENMHFRPEILKALNTLDIAYPFTKELIKNQYRNKLKQYHPDTKNTIHTSDNVSYNRHITIDDIVESYKILDNYFNLSD